MNAGTKRSRRVGTRLVPPVPAPVEPLELDVQRDDDGSPVRDALLDYGPFVAFLVLLVLAGLFVIDRVFGGQVS